MECNKCMLGAPCCYCFQVSCINYNQKKEQEQQWDNLIKSLLSLLGEKNES